MVKNHNSSKNSRLIERNTAKYVPFVVPSPLDKLFKLLFTYISDIFIAGPRQHPASARCESMSDGVRGDTRRVDQQKPKIQIKMTTKECFLDQFDTQSALRKSSTQGERRYFTVGMSVAGHRATGIFVDFTEGHRSFGTNSTSTIHKSCAASSKHPRQQRSVARNISSQKFSSAQSSEVLKFDNESHAPTERQERVDISQEYLQAQRNGQNYLLLTCRSKWSLPAPSTRKSEERESVVDTSASMHMVSRKDLNSVELETVTAATPSEPSHYTRSKCVEEKKYPRAKVIHVHAFFDNRADITS